jgi:hypothetical protein
MTSCLNEWRGSKVRYLICHLHTSNESVFGNEIESQNILFHFCVVGVTIHQYMCVSMISFVWMRIRSNLKRCQRKKRWKLLQRHLAVVLCYSSLFFLMVFISFLMVFIFHLHTLDTLSHHLKYVFSSHQYINPTHLKYIFPLGEFFFIHFISGSTLAIKSRIEVILTCNRVEPDAFLF